MYNYIPVKTIFTATLWLHYMAHVMLFPMINVLYFYIVLCKVCVHSAQYDSFL